jgi:hypothetical protein
MLDTGDLIFMEHLCHKAFKVSEMRYCYTNKLHKFILSKIGYPKSEWDSSAILLRDSKGPRVLFHFFGTVYDLGYDDFLRIPFIQDVALKKLKTKKLEMGFVSSDFRNFIINKYKNTKNNFLTGKIGNGIEIILEYWIHSGLTNIEKLKENPITSIEGIDNNLPKVLDHEVSSYSEPIIVRTKVSKNDTKNY